MRVSLPEPLDTALKGAARLMANGLNGTAAKGSEIDNYGALCALHGKDIVPFLTQAIEDITNGQRVLQLADESLFPIAIVHQAYLCLVITDAGTPEDANLEREGNAAFYVLNVPSEPTMVGVAVRKVR
jgi:hypothetical protein